jgi:hypothetical protein
LTISADNPGSGCTIVVQNDAEEELEVAIIKGTASTYADFAGATNGKELTRDTSERWSFDEDGTYSVGAVGDRSGDGGIKQVYLSGGDDTVTIRFAPNDLTFKVHYVPCHKPGIPRHNWYIFYGRRG